jgi:monofunctional biosynthetic peptidoglycan transglycosylase
MWRWLLKTATRVVLAVLAITVLVVLPWRWINPPTTAFILQDQITRQRPVQYQWLPMEQISPQLAIAVIASEDQKFPTHHGFDIDQIRKVVSQQGGPSRGASTLTQQVAKNLYLWPGKSYLRKGLEAWLTVWLELLWPKQRILHTYLNIAEFAPGVFGAGAASQSLFNRPASQISARQAATLAAVLPNPKRFSAARPSAYVQRRAVQIEQAVAQLGGTSYLSKL